MGNSPLPGTSGFSFFKKFIFIIGKGLLSSSLFIYKNFDTNICTTCDINRCWQVYSFEENYPYNTLQNNNDINYQPSKFFKKKIE